MYIFAEPVTEERADEIQSTGEAFAKDWARRVVGVGKGDADAQEAWQDLQEEVDEQVSEDGTASKVEAVQESAMEDDVTATSEPSEPNETENDEPVIIAPKSTKDTTSSGPLMGWTLTVRNKVNGHYLKRPEGLEPDDNWQLEYHINEIEGGAAWGIYNKLKERRRQLIGLNDEEVDKGLTSYRKVIQRYASRGRKWRATQDQINEARGVQVYKPLGPGSEEYASARAESEKGKDV
jgi:hypothetical protein